MKKQQIKLNDAELKNQAKQIEFITTAAVGFPVVICQGTTAPPKQGSEWQIMPDDEFESGVEDFWNWHVDTNEQWFGTMLEAATKFVFRRQQFALSQCPHKHDEEHEEFEKVFQDNDLDFGKIG